MVPLLRRNGKLLFVFAALKGWVQLAIVEEKERAYISAKEERVYVSAKEGRA